MPLEWTPQQRAALQVMGIPVWNEKPISLPLYYYRLGPLYLKGTTELPVSPPVWLNDLSLYFEQRPVAVKAPPETPPLCVDYEQWLTQLPSSSQKKALWKHITHGSP